MEPERLDCQAVREHVLECTEPKSAPVREHVAQCAECARWCEQLAKRVAVLRRLERLSAPLELDGCVVAALEPGARHERAIEALARLGRLTTPAELDGAVDATAQASTRGRWSAPSVLERLVVEEMADPAKARTRRFVGSLPRNHAPAELDARVEGELLHPRRAPSRGMRLAVLASLAAAILVSVVAPLVLSLRGVGEKRYPFRVEHVQADAMSLLDAQSHTVLDEFSGGMLSAHRI